MAIVLLSKSKCHICDKTMEETDEIISFTSFLPKDHHFYFYSDAAFHKTCLESKKNFSEVLELYNGYQTLLQSRPEPPPNVDNFIDWYKESKEVKEWEDKIDAYILKSYKNKD